MFNRSILSFSLSLGGLSAVAVTIAFKTTTSGPIQVLPIAAMIALAAVLISIQRIPEFKPRFAMGFLTTIIAFVPNIIGAAYSRGFSGPLWAEIFTIGVNLLAASVIGLAIGAISRPWSAPHQTFDPA